MADRSYLVQKFARLNLGTMHVIGYSVAGEETVVQIPELDVCFDIGRCPHFALTSNIVCLSHGHMDHLAGLGYYLSQRHFQGMKPGTVLVPADLADPLENLLRCWRQVERQGTPYKLVPMSPGEVYEVRRDFVIRALETHHGGSSLGYSLISVREKLKPEYMGTPGPQLAEMRKRGVVIQYRTEVPLVTFLGDTTAGPVYEHPDVVNAEVLITECTFFDPTHKQRAKVGKHLHVEHLLQILPKLNNKHLILTHVSRRTSIRRAKRFLEKKLTDEQRERIIFLMDLADATPAGEVEDIGPLPKGAAD